MTLRRRMLAWRKKHKATQWELAEVAGVSQAMISRLESGCDAKWSSVEKVLAAIGALPDQPTPPEAEMFEGTKEDESAT